MRNHPLLSFAAPWPLQALLQALLLALLLSAAALPGQVMAQKMYRCGSSYQDKPCDNGQKEKVIGKAVTATPTDKPALDLSCVQRGEEAKKVIWMREGGAQQDKLMKEASTTERRKVIADVYAQRGNAMDIRARIESDCMVEKENERKFGTALVTEDPAKRTQAAEHKASQGESPADAAKRTSADAARTKTLCEDVRKQLASVQSAQRTGGQGSAMDELTRNKREIESNLKSLGCDAAPKTTMQ
ncbi:hypothetical protein ACO0LM_26825 [Undibacterium sp. Di26W]|uniref:hypothetical protein n=1 Tax=Undibacterium sp. Di26W TaxID=3413035 RepID=UPI003BF0F01A